MKEVKRITGVELPALIETPEELVKDIALEVGQATHDFIHSNLIHLHA